MQSHFEGMDYDGRKKFKGFFGPFLPGGKYHNPDKKMQEAMRGQPTTNDLAESIFGNFDRIFRHKINANDLSTNGVLLWKINKVPLKITALLPATVRLLVRLCIRMGASDLAKHKEKLALHARNRFLGSIEKNKSTRQAEHRRLVEKLTALTTTTLFTSATSLRAAYNKETLKTRKLELLKRQVKLLKARGLPPSDAPAYTKYGVTVPDDAILLGVGTLLDAVQSGGLKLDDEASKFKWGTDWKFDTEHNLPPLAAVTEEKRAENTRREEATAGVTSALQAAKEKKAMEERDARAKLAAKEQREQDMLAKRAKRAEEREATKAAKTAKTAAKVAQKAMKAAAETAKKAEAKQAKEDHKEEMQEAKKEYDEERAKEVAEIRRLRAAGGNINFIQCDIQTCRKWRILGLEEYTEYIEQQVAFECDNICFGGCRTQCDGCKFSGSTCDCPVAVEKKEKRKEQEWTQVASRKDKMNGKNGKNGKNGNGGNKQPQPIKKHKGRSRSDTLDWSLPK